MSKIPKVWFSYDPGDGFRLHDTAEEARKAAEDALQFYRDESGDGWQEEVEQVCWGKCVQQVEMLWRKTRPPKEEIDEDGHDEEGHQWGDFDELCDYGLRPELTSTASPPPVG